MAVLKQTSPGASPTAPRPKPSSTVPSASTRSAVARGSVQPLSAGFPSEAVMSMSRSRPRQRQNAGAGLWQSTPPVWNASLKEPGAARQSRLVQAAQEKKEQRDDEPARAIHRRSEGSDEGRREGQGRRDPPDPGGA